MSHFLALLPPVMGEGVGNSSEDWEVDIHPHLTDT